MDWKECFNKQIAKGVKIDNGMVKSLIKSSENRAESENRLEMSNVTAASKISLAYDSLRELLEALALRHGYKIYNHECYCAFFKEVLKQSMKGDEFDSIRRVRNAINYYGKSVSVEDAKDIIKKIKDMRIFVMTLFNV